MNAGPDCISFPRKKSLEPSVSFVFSVLSSASGRTQEQAKKRGWATLYVI
jgi:hypothetical protein